MGSIYCNFLLLFFFLVMATLQLPANNLANLANLPPGTKLYLTTNSKNPSGKGKLLLIPQGAILRASSASETRHILCFLFLGILAAVAELLQHTVGHCHLFPSDERRFFFFYCCFVVFYCFFLVITPYNSTSLSVLCCYLFKMSGIKNKRIVYLVWD